jgi:hypothetical protein
LGSPPQPHRVIASDVVPFVLHPQIVPTLDAGAVKVDFTPKVGKSQRVALILNELTNRKTPLPNTYRIGAPKDNGIVTPGQDDTGSIRFAISGVASGAYLVRVQVDGAESMLKRDATTGLYLEPKVAIP